MNPILLKPETDDRSQVVVRARAIASLDWRGYERLAPTLWPVVVESLERLRAAHDLVVIEGAGNPAEINLECDLANMRVAAVAGAPVLLVGDIDRGGVFAALVGTLALLSPDDRARVAGLVVNRFRGDPSVLAPGLELLAARAGVPVLGVVPHLGEAPLPEEDSLGLEDRGDVADALVSVAVARLPRIANFDDLEPLTAEPRVAVRFVTRPEAVDAADVVVLPGSKTTVADLAWLRERGLAAAIARAAADGRVVIGLCGGYQMLGERLDDPDRVESAAPRVSGLGLLPVVTTFAREKTTVRARGRVLAGGPFRAVAGARARPARHARPRGHAGRPAHAHRLARAQRHRERLRARRRGAHRRRERLLRLAAGRARQATRGRDGQPESRDARRAQAGPRGRHRRGQPRGDVRPAPAARDSRVHRARPPHLRDVRPHRAGRSADRAAGRGRPARGGHPAAHRCRARRREGAARAARAVCALARSAARAGPRLPPHGDDRAGGRPLDHRRRARELRALQHRGGRRARAGGHRAGRSLHRRLDGGARGPGEVAGVDERARHSRRPPVLGGPVGPAPLRLARAGGPRAARADDPSRGVQVTDVRRLARALAALSLVLLAVGVTALFVGSAGLSPSAVARALAGRAEASSVEVIVTLSLRLPPVAAGVLAGSSLAVAGGGFP